MIISRILRGIDHPYITGKGGRRENNSTIMQGLTRKSLAHHTALQPLFFFIGGGMIFVAAYLFRLASKTTDINWKKSKNPDAPYNYYSERQFKFLNPLGVDYSKPSPRPDYEN